MSKTIDLSCMPCCGNSSSSQSPAGCCEFVTCPTSIFLTITNSDSPGCALNGTFELTGGCTEITAGRWTYDGAYDACNPEAVITINIECVADAYELTISYIDSNTGCGGQVIAPTTLNAVSCDPLLLEGTATYSDSPECDGTCGCFIGDNLTFEVTE